MADTWGRGWDPSKNREPLERLMEKVDKQPSGCWIWRAYRNPRGYGRTILNGKMTPAHRAVYQLLVGPVPEGLQLDHLCRNRACVNPAHLEPVTNAENIRRGSRVQATHCLRGHPWTPENTYQYPRRRVCRECQKARNQKYLRKIADG